MSGDGIRSAQKVNKNSAHNTMCFVRGNKEKNEIFGDVLFGFIQFVPHTANNESCFLCVIGEGHTQHSGSRRADKLIESDRGDVFIVHQHAAHVLQRTRGTAAGRCPRTCLSIAKSHFSFLGNTSTFIRKFISFAQLG
jgi:hypothetical protein